MIGDASKAREKLGWYPQHTIDELVKEMVTSDIELFKRSQTLKKAGFRISNEYE